MTWIPDDLPSLDDLVRKSPDALLIAAAAARIRELEAENTELRKLSQPSTKVTE